MPNLKIVTDQLLQEIEESSYTEQGQWLFLLQSDNFKGYWEVDAIDPSFLFDFEDLIGGFKLISPMTVNEFLERAEAFGYKVAFMEDPTEILNAFEYLKDTPEISLNSTLAETTNGFLPWQISGYNKLIKDETLSAGLVVWTTGAGKAAHITAAIKYHMEIGHPFDVAFVFVKSHNKIDTQRKLKQLGNINSIIVDGDWNIQRQKDKVKYTAPGPRQLLYDDIDDKLNKGEQVVIITNYEKIREDLDRIQTIVNKRNCLFFFDEAPTKLANRTTQLYKATRKLMYNAFPNKPRTNWKRCWALTATPIENSPEDVFSVTNLMAPGVLGNVTEFYKNHASGWDIFGKPHTWQNLDAMEAKLQFMTHRVSRDDPEVAKMFPNVIDMPISVDWNPKHLNIYDKLTTKALDIFEEDEDVNILSLIQIMQMMCDAPSMIQMSANNRKMFYAALDDTEDALDMPITIGSDIAFKLIEQLGPEIFTDVGHTKLEMWKEIITERHPNDKIVTHSTWSDYIFPIWEEYLTKWGVSYVVYNGTSKEKQYALDSFRDDPSIRCFLSSDAGADSIDIVEAAVGVNYNIPWKWTTLQQRQGRRDRVNSTHKQIYTYTLTMPNSVEERKYAVCNRKYGYHAQLFDGKAQDEVVSATLSKEELLYLLFG